MKKILSLVLALVMVLSMAVVASAETYEGNVTFENLPADTGKDWKSTNQSTGEVKVEITPETPDPVYYVTVEWGDLTFEYSFETGNEVWNPMTHSFTEGSATGWVGSKSANVEVKNHSSVAVQVDVGFRGTTEASVTKEGVTAALSGELSKELATGVGLTWDTAASLVATVTVSGVPTTTNTSVSVAVVEVNIAAA